MIQPERMIRQEFTGSEEGRLVNGQLSTVRHSDSPPPTREKNVGGDLKKMQVSFKHSCLGKKNQLKSGGDGDRGEDLM